MDKCGGAGPYPEGGGLCYDNIISFLASITTQGLIVFLIMALFCVINKVNRFLKLQLIANDVPMQPNTLRMRELASPAPSRTRTLTPVEGQGKG